MLVSKVQTLLQVTFNDFGPDFSQNVNFRLTTVDVQEFKQVQIIKNIHYFDFYQSILFYPKATTTSAVYNMFFLGNCVLGV